MGSWLLGLAVVLIVMLQTVMVIVLARVCDRMGELAERKRWEQG